MSGRTVSGVIPAPLQEVAQNAAEYEGTSMSAIVSSALTLWLGLPAAARRTARYVLSQGSPDARETLLEGCGRAIAHAGDEMLRARLAERGKSMGLAATAMTEEQIAQEAIDAVRDARRVVSGREPEKKHRSAR